MHIRKELINDVLRQVAVILQSYRPNVEELEIIRSKIDIMVEKNRIVAIKKQKLQTSFKNHAIPEKWYKIKIDD
ncbi:MAG: hypothetical protein HeimC3_02850 [Candidatus Heimdallarchaeota archaeon LC_3]|nr:MAG: hypothetical protein HeimC3_02850 [Candidatus Heimdallarchaeota archaeon LC_3]